MMTIVDFLVVNFFIMEHRAIWLFRDTKRNTYMLEKHIVFKLEMTTTDKISKVL